LSSSKRPIFTYLGSMERSWPGSKRIFDLKMRLRFVPDSKRSKKKSNFGHDRVLSIRNFMLTTTAPSNYSFEHLCYSYDPIKVPKSLKKSLLLVTYLFQICPQRLLHEEKTLHFPGFEPGTFRFEPMRSSRLPSYQL
jgi:hypothetical protein